MVGDAASLPVEPIVEAVVRERRQRVRRKHESWVRVDACIRSRTPVFASKSHVIRMLQRARSDSGRLRGTSSREFRVNTRFALVKRRRVPHESPPHSPPNRSDWKLSRGLSLERERERYSPLVFRENEANSSETAQRTLADGPPQSSSSTCIRNHVPRRTHRTGVREGPRGLPTRHLNACSRWLKVGTQERSSSLCCESEKLHKTRARYEECERAVRDVDSEVRPFADRLSTRHSVSSRMNTPSKSSRVARVLNAPGACQETRLADAPGACRESLQSRTRQRRAKRRFLARRDEMARVCSRVR